MPCVYALTTNKKRRTYETIFEEIKNAIYFQPEFIITDFEQAAISSIKKLFKSTQPQGCYFHFCQSIYRAIQRVGLQKQHTDNPDTAMELNMLMALAYVPVNDVREVFQDLVKFGIFDTSNTSIGESISSELSHTEPSDSVNNSESTKPIRDLIQYFSDNWVGSTIKPAPYPLSLWNMYDAVRADRSRTNNCVEAWHNSINTCIGKKGNIFKFFEFLKREEGMALYRNTQNIESGRNKTIKRQKYSIKDSKIKDIVLTYDAEKTDKIEYLKSLSKHIHVPNAH